MALISPVMYNAQIYSVPLSDRPIRPSSSLPFSLPGPAATTEKKKGGEREKNVQGRTLTSAACNIPYGRSSVIFSGKSVAGLSLSLSLPLFFYRVEAGPDSGFSTGGRKGGEDGEDDESREDC